MPVALQLVPLKNCEGADRALDILARIAGLVEPILARRPTWRVGQLREFFPKNEILLGMNVNRGSKSEDSGRHLAVLLRRSRLYQSN